jgi:hypothetical protein
MYLIHEDLWDYVTEDMADSKNYSAKNDKKTLSKKCPYFKKILEIFNSYFLRLLLHAVGGPTSFASLKTVEGEEC